MKKILIYGHKSFLAKNFINDYDKKYKLGTCIICERRNVKVSADLCKKCHKLIRYDVDTLQKAVLYLQKNNR